MKKFAFLILTLVLILGSAIPAFAAAKSQGSAAAVKLEKYTGTVTITNASGKEVTAREGLRLYSGYTVKTGKNSSAYISLDSTKALMQESSSKLSFKKSGSKIDVMLESGTVVSDISAPLKKEESLDIHTTNMVTGIRGTFVEVSYSGAQGATSINMMHGGTNNFNKFNEKNVFIGEGHGLTIGGGAANVTPIPGSIVITDLKPETQQMLVIDRVGSNPSQQGFDEVFGISGLNDQQKEELGKAVSNAVEIYNEQQQNADDEAGKAAEEALSVSGAAVNEIVDPVFDSQGNASDSGAANASVLPDEIGTDAPANSSSDGGSSGGGGSSSGGGGTSGGGSSGNPADSKALMEDLADGSATINPDGWTVSYTGVTVGDGQTLNITGSGTVSMPDLKIAEGGTVNVDSGSTLAVSGSASAVDGTLNNNGTVNMNGVTINAGDNIVVNQGSTLSFTGGTNNNYGTITNNGTLINEQGSTLNNLSATIVNAGTFTNRGVFNNGSSSNSGRVVNTNGTISNSGTFTNDYGEITLDGTVTGVSFTVSFDANGGTVGSTSVSVNFGGTVSAQEVEKEGSEFNGWFLNGSAYDFSTQVVRDITLTAQWTDIPAPTTYTVTFNSDGGSAVEALSLKEGDPVNAPEAPTKEGYDFAGWQPALPDIMPAADLSVTATWSAKSFTVTYKVDGEVYGDVDTVAYGTQLTARPAPAKEGYTFSGWSEIPATMPASNLEISGTFTVNKYTITWKNDADTVIDTTEVEYGVVPTHANPTKEADAQYTYIFDHWDNTPAAVTGDATYTAVYSSAVNIYTIKFVDEDGTELSSSDFAYGTSAETITPEKTPQKEGDAQYTYTFAGWNPEVAEVTGAATYTATYTSETNYYTITWQQDDGKVIDATVFAYGTTPTHADPTKDATSEYTYTFAGWTPELAPASEDTFYKASYTSTPVNYTVTYKVDGEVYGDVDTVAYGATLTARPAPVKEGYTFSGWSEIPATMPASDLVITGTFTINKYTVTWKNYDGTVLETDDDAYYGSNPYYDSDEPVREGNAQYGYAFTGWDPEMIVGSTTVSGDITYTAQFEQFIKTYAVYWMNYDGSTIWIDTGVEYGTVPEYTQETVPTRAADSKYTYTFSGWSPEPAAITGATEYTAQFTETPVNYTVTYKVDGEVYGEVDTVAYGTQLTARANPEMEGHEFSGWSGFPTDGKMPDSDLEITGTFTPNYYTVTWKNGNTVLETDENVAYGTTPEYNGDTPEKAETAQFTYAFLGWDPAITADTKVEADITYTAQFTETVNKYTVKFVNADENNTVISETQYDYGTAVDDINVPANPTKEKTAQYTYIFEHWDKDIVPVTEDATYTAVYSSTVNLYTIKFVDDDDEEISSSDYAYGTTADTIKPADPEKDATDEFTYTFAGWTPALADVTGEATYKATYTSTKNKYTITWNNDDNSLIETTEVEYGTVPTHADATKEATAEYSYTFAGWTPTPVAVTGAATYKASFTQTAKEYTVTYKVDGEVSGEVETFAYGATLTPRTAPAKEGYTFSGWSEIPATMPARNLEITGTFAVNKYTVTWKNYDGTTLETDANVEYGTTPTYDGDEPTKTATAQYTYTFDGWDPAVSAVTGEVTYTAKFKETVNKYTVTFVNANNNNSVISTQEVEYGGYATKPADPAFTGHTFAGWYGDADQQFSFETTAITGATTINAVFTVNSYNLTYVYYEGKEPTVINLFYGERITTPDDPVRTGYTFTGWDKTIPETMPAERLTITATWEDIYLNVEFLTDGGTPTPKAQNVKYGSTATAPDAPERAGYTFDGWYETDSTTAFDFSTPIKSETILTAHWLENHTVTFDYNDGKTASTVVTVADGRTVDKPTDPQREGYTFDGWYLVAATETQFVFTSTVDEDITLKAHWTALTVNYTVKHLQQNLDGTGYTEVSDDTQTLPGAVDSTTEAVAKTYTGFTAQTITQQTISADGSTVVEIKYDRNKYTVIWKNDDGSTLETDENVVYGATPSYNGTTPTKAADAQYTYTFAGWDPELSEVTSDKTYTAVYDSTVNQYTVTLNYNYTGSPAAKEIVLDYGSKVTVPADFTREGYTLGGLYINTTDVWNLDNDTVNGDVTLMAVWTANEVTVTAFFPSAGYREVFSLNLDNLDDNDMSQTEGDSAITIVAHVGDTIMVTPRWDDYNISKWEVADTEAYDVEEIEDNEQPSSFNLTGFTDDFEIMFNVEIGMPEDDERTVAQFAADYFDSEAGLNRMIVNYPENKETVPDDTSIVKYKPYEVYFTVTFYSDKAGATGMPANIENQRYNTPVSKPSTDPTLDGSTFAGWCSDNDPTTFYDFSTPVTEDITLYAKWGTYTVTFDSNGGDYIAPIVTDGYFERPDDPTRDGYSFAGWYADSELKQEFEWQSDYSSGVVSYYAEIESSMTLHAKWEIALTVTYLSHNTDYINVSGVSSFTSSSGDGEYRILVEDGEVSFRIVAIDGSLYDVTPYADGITFVKGTSTSNGTDYSATGITASAELKFDIISKDTYSSTVAQVIENAQSLANTYSQDKGIHSVTMLVPAPLYSGLTDTDFIKYLSYDAYTITFNSNGGSAVDPMYVDADDSDVDIWAPEEPTYTGYEFGGWFTDADCTQEFTFCHYDSDSGSYVSSTPVTENITLYAKWTAKDTANIYVPGCANTMNEDECIGIMVLFGEDGQANEAGNYPIALDVSGGSSVNVTVNYSDNPEITDLTLKASGATVTLNDNEEGVKTYTLSGIQDDVSLSFELNVKFSSITEDEFYYRVNTYTFAEGIDKVAFNVPSQLMNVASEMADENTTFTSYEAYTLTFNAGIGMFPSTEESVLVMYVAPEESIMQPENPEADNAGFTGWYEEGSTTVFDFSTPITESMTLEAHWTLTGVYVPKSFSAGTTGTAPYTVSLYGSDGAIKTLTVAAEDAVSFFSASSDSVYTVTVGADNLICAVTSTPMTAIFSGAATGSISGTSFDVESLTGAAQLLNLQDGYTVFLGSTESVGQDTVRVWAITSSSAFTDAGYYFFTYDRDGNDTADWVFVRQ